MIAHFPQLHEHAHDAEEVTVCEDVPCLIKIYVLVIEESLSPREVALHNMLDLLWQLLLNVFFHPPEEKWSKDGLKFLDHSEIEAFVLVY